MFIHGNILHLDASGISKEIQLTPYGLYEQDLDTEIIVAAAREPSTNATAVSANLVVDERQMNALFLDLVKVVCMVLLKFFTND